MRTDESQGLCETTQTMRFVPYECKCKTYEGNFGPCKTFEEGANGNCVYCDHGEDCHKLKRLIRGESIK